MRELLKKARTRAGMAVVGGVLIATAGVGTAAAVVGSPTPVEVADTEPTPTEPAVTTPAAVTPAPTVAAVTTPQATPADLTEPVDQPAPVDVPADGEQPAADQDGSGSYDPNAPFTDRAGNTYLPAPDVPVEPLPGEPNYVPPAG